MKRSSELGCLEEEEEEEDDDDDDGGFPGSASFVRVL
jgi:hypothetical protein